MKPPKNETAAPTGIGNGGDRETGQGFEKAIYGATAIGSIPSPEHAGRVALVVARGDRLFAVDHRPDVGR